MNPADLSTCDLLTCRLRLSDELVFAPQEHAGATCYHIEVPSQGQFFRVGYPEYVLLSLLDGRTTLAQALTLSVRALGAKALSQTQALEVAVWLMENGLARLAHDTQAGQRSSEPSPRGAAGVLRHLNPFWLRLPVLHPDRLLTWLVPLVGWLFSPLLTVVGVLLIGAGVVVAATDWERFIASSHLIFSPGNWLSMGLAWMGLKAVHELAHALACKRYGGHVREAGLVLILFAPAAFVDVTTSWRFPSKWQRIHVAAAGMYVELVLAALAVMAWSRVDSVLLRHLLFNVILMASFSTLVFNANPLMRFDGYYILADLLEIPNLASESARFVQYLGARVFFGRAAPSRELRGGPRLGGARLRGRCLVLASDCLRLAAGRRLRAVQGRGRGPGCRGSGLLVRDAAGADRARVAAERSRNAAGGRASRMRGGRARGSGVRRAGLGALAGNGHRAGGRRVHRSVDRPQRGPRLYRQDPRPRRAARRRGRPAAGTEERRSGDGIPRTPVFHLPG